ncbi:hypothetical protein KHA80_07625 [Anaerobacillus sp. HL2]|nr:hypothetical protein KHA80_07625 [Anaerobacillus sp. HL2]
MPPTPLVKPIEERRTGLFSYTQKLISTKLENELDKNVQAIDKMNQGFNEAEDGAGFADAVNQASFR